jgi:hypothetical protein
MPDVIFITEGTGGIGIRAVQSVRGWKRRTVSNIDFIDTVK